MDPTQRSAHCTVQPYLVEETIKNLTADGFQLAITTQLKSGLVRIDAVRIKQLTNNSEASSRRNALFVSKEDEAEWKRKNDIPNK